MKVLVTGASGLIGTELIRVLQQQGHTADAWKRGTKVSVSEMETYDAVVNLAGASGSASGFYGDTKEVNATEETPKGTGFLSDLSADWEAAATKAKTRVVVIRTTMVMSRKLGALGRLLPLIKWGVGGPLASGRQWWAWISLPDEVNAIIHLINSETASGVYNLTAPEPATCIDVVRSLAKHLKRPALVPVPAFALRLAFGEGADELLICNQKLSAEKLLKTGFKFQHPTLDSASAWVTKNPAD